MNPLRERLIEDMQLRNFSAHTIEAYVNDNEPSEEVADSCFNRRCAWVDSKQSP